MESEGDEASPKRQKWSSPTNPSLHLAQELITAILVRLPVKYLLQFKCVSKDWLRLISSPEFVKTHLRCSAKDCRFLLWNTYKNKVEHCSVTSLFNDPFTELINLDYPLEKCDRDVCLVGSVNGLICFENRSDGSFIILNPSTRKFKKVPPLIDDGEVFTYGFGYDKVHDDYKVVGITFPLTSNLVCAKMYSVRSDSWKTLDYHGQSELLDSAKLVNGKLHWVNSTVSGDDWCIISFDLVDENFGTVVPPYYDAEKTELSLGVLGSDLSMLCNCVRSNVAEDDVWVMKEYGVNDSWTKMYTIRYCYDPMWSVTSPPVCMSSKGESLFVSWESLFVYNPEDKSFRKIIEAYGILYAELYIESLVCPFLQNEPITQH